MGRRLARSKCWLVAAAVSACGLGGCTSAEWSKMGSSLGLGVVQSFVNGVAENGSQLGGDSVFVVSDAVSSYDSFWNNGRTDQIRW